MNMSRPARGILSATGVAVPLAVALGVSIWRYDVAITKSNEATKTRAEATKVQLAETAFFHEREGMNEFLIVGDPHVLVEVKQQATGFGSTLDQLGLDQHPGEASLINQATAANEGFLAEFARVQETAATNPKLEQAAVARLNLHEGSVTKPLNALLGLFAVDVPQRVAAARSARHDALIAALVGGLVAILGALAFAAYSIRLVGRLARREGASCT